jgi:hypothetical protein
MLPAIVIAVLLAAPVLSGTLMGRSLVSLAPRSPTTPCAYTCPDTPSDTLAWIEATRLPTEHLLRCMYNATADAAPAPRMHCFYRTVSPPIPFAHPHTLISCLQSSDERPARHGRVLHRLPFQLGAFGRTILWVSARGRLERTSLLCDSERSEPVCRLVRVPARPHLQLLHRTLLHSA